MQLNFYLLSFTFWYSGNIIQLSLHCYCLISVNFVQSVEIENMCVRTLCTLVSSSRLWWIKSGFQIFWIVQRKPLMVISYQHFPFSIILRLIHKNWLIVFPVSKLLYKCVTYDKLGKKRGFSYILNEHQWDDGST